MLQQLLLEEIEIKAIFDNQAKRSFSSADVNTVISLFRRPDKVISITSQRRENHLARFVAFKKPFEVCLTADNLVAILKENRVETTDDYRLYPISQGDLFHEGVEKTEQETMLKSKMTGKYTGGKWGGKYLRAPDIFFTILEKGKGKLVRLGDIAEVRFGIKTGANEFFYLDQEKIDEWGIEEEFLRPVIKSPRECRSILIKPEDLKYKVFMCHKERERLRGTAALEYIDWGEKKGFHERPSCRGRPRWWDLGIWDFAQLLWVETMYNAFRVYRNTSEVYESDKFDGLVKSRKLEF